MRLTEREKWLMQAAWFACLKIEKKSMDEWLSESVGSLSQENVLEHNAPKSIVKKVDPKNLPDFGVLILDQKSELYSTGLFIENQRVVGFLNSKHEITRYIEIKDIIKLLEDSK